MGNKPRFGLDLDGVCYEWNRTAMYMLRAYRGYTREQLPGESAATCWGWIERNVKPEDWQWLWDDGVKLGLFRYGHLYPGAMKAVQELAQKVDIVVLTHRPHSAAEDTFAWLAYNRVPVQEVHILSGYKAKSSVSCDYYLDDKPEVIDDVVRYLPDKAMLWRRPWNADRFNTQRVGVSVVSSWDEVLKEVGI